MKPGQRVLVNGASGGVGTFTVQIAKTYGAIVTGVCSTKNLDLVKSIGADHVIDYTKVDFTQTAGQGYDLIIDNVGNCTVSDYRHALSETGKCNLVGYTSNALFQHLLWAPLSSIGRNRKVAMMPTAQSNKKDLTTLKELVESGRVKPVIDKRYPLKDTAEAVRHLETGHARGKVVITV